MLPEVNAPGPRFEEILSNALAFRDLAPGEVQLWAVHLKPGRSVVDDLASYLSSNELGRAGRYHYERDRRRYVARWGFTRSLLGHHLSCPPDAVRFATGPAGKPFIHADPDLHFNLSHSGDLALIGVSRDGPLGIDIENTRPIKDTDAIVRRFFAPREVAAYFQVPAHERRVVFFNCWTRKEAIVKAWGDGLLLSLDLFEVSILRREAARVVSISDDATHSVGWTLIHLEPAADFIGALAIRQAPLKISACIVDLDRTALPVFV